MPKPIYVIGHRSPDTDAICSAIAYAHLKQAMGENAIPARAGKINAETKYVLEYFGVEIPVFIDDWYPRVKDIMNENAVTILSGSNLHELGKVMKQHKMKSVPVITKDKTLAGVVSVSDLAKRYFEELEMQDLCHAGVDFAGILRVLDGTLVCGEDLQRKVFGKVRIAAARTETMSKQLNSGDVVLAGDRIQVHLACVECKIACLIITGDGNIDEKVISAANKAGVIIIQSPHDTYTCGRLINQSIPVDIVMEKNIISFKPTDLVSDIRDTIVGTNHRNYPVVEKGKFLGLINRDKLIVPERERVILVDHNEHTQAVEGIEETQILEIVDHHRLGGLQTSEPIFIRHEPVGCTATIVANMHWHRNVEIPKTIAGLMLSAIISDTVLFKSPTATKKDRDTAEKLAKIAELDLHEFGMEILKAGADLGHMSVSEIVHNDLKEFHMGEYKIAIGQISVMAPEIILATKDHVLRYMNTLQAKEKYDMVMLLITDIINASTHLIYTEECANLVSKAYGRDGEGNVLYLANVMSRKKQIVPPLIEASRD